MKLRISYKPTPQAEAAAPKVCGACAGSGWYDWTDPRTGRQPRCGACGGTGFEALRDAAGID